MKFEIDAESATWKALTERTNDRISALRLRNDGALDEVQTAHLRGRIYELKELLTLATPDPALIVDE